MEKTEEFIPNVTKIFKSRGYDFGMHRLPQVSSTTPVYHIRNSQTGNCVITATGLSITVQLEPRNYPPIQYHHRIQLKYGTQKKGWHPNGRIHDSIFTPEQYFQQFPDEAFIVVSVDPPSSYLTDPLLGYISQRLGTIEQIGMAETSYNGYRKKAEQLKNAIGVAEGDNLEEAVERIASFYVGLRMKP